MFDDLKADQAKSKEEFNYMDELTERFKSLGNVFINEVGVDSFELCDLTK